MKLLSLSGLLQLGSLIVLVWLPAGCLLLDHRPEPSNCRLTGVSVSNEVRAKALTYTADGKLASYGADRYTYNAEGFVITKLTYDGANPYIRHTYEYSQGRLVKDIEYRYATDRNLSTETFEYDSNGQLSRVFYQVTGGALFYNYTYLFSGGKQTDYIEYDGGTGKYTQPYRFENGLVKAAGTPPSVTEYTYNTAGQLVSTANEGTGIYHMYEYTNGIMATLAIPTFKGWPLLAFNATNLTTSGLMLKDTEYRKDLAGIRYKYEEIIHTYVLTAAGYPLRDQVDYQDYSPTNQLTSQGRLSDTSYTYDKCQ